MTTTTGSAGSVSAPTKTRQIMRPLRRHPAIAFVLRRVGAAIITLIIVSMLIFAGTNLLPGNAARAILGQHATPASVAIVERELGLNHSITERYWSWFTGVLHGNLGQSAVGAVLNGSEHASVAGLISGPLGDSAILAAIAFLILVPLALLIGVFSATRVGRWSDTAISMFSLGLVSLPEFVTGSLLVLLFAVGLGWLPAVSLVAPGQSVLSHPEILILPVATLVSASLAWTTRFIRSSVAESLRSDYVTAAILGGVGDRRVLWRYAVRNALAPTVQVVAQTAQWLVGGIVITETVFAYPGIGQALVNAVNERDIPVVQSIALILAAFYIALNIVADLVVVLLVPKLRTSW
jgi:peptide/nickel transport system permease protein